MTLHNKKMTVKQGRCKIRTEKAVELKHIIYIPERFYIDDKKDCPLLIYLHGRDERSDDTQLLRNAGLPRYIEEGHSIPFVVLAPLCPSGTEWIFQMENIYELILLILPYYNIDPKKIYLTGNSMGGYGTWNLAIAYPDRFAAIAPICGGGPPRMVQAIKHVPVWAFHGAKDDTVPLAESQQMVDALRACGGRVKFTIYPDVEHDSWTPTYDNPALYEWLLQHKKKS